MDKNKKSDWSQRVGGIEEGRGFRGTDRGDRVRGMMWAEERKTDDREQLKT